MSRSAFERTIKPVLLTGVNATPQNIKTSNGFLVKVIAYNNDVNTVRFLQIFDALAADVTVGTTTPKYVLPITAAVIDDNDFGVEFDNAISIACTTTETGATGATTGATVTALATKN